MNNSKNIKIGIVFGIIAGMLNVAPMIIQRLPFSALASAFSMWVTIGFFIATSNLAINKFFKGILLSFLALIPAAILIGAEEFASLVPIALFTLILGSLLGYSIDKYQNK